MTLTVTIGDSETLAGGLSGPDLPVPEVKNVSYARIRETADRRSDILEFRVQAHRFSIDAPVDFTIDIDNVSRSGFVSSIIWQNKPSITRVMGQRARYERQVAALAASLQPTSGVVTPSVLGSGNNVIVKRKPYFDTPPTDTSGNYRFFIHALADGVVNSKSYRQLANKLDEYGLYVLSDGVTLASELQATTESPFFVPSGTDVRQGSQVLEVEAWERRPVEITNHTTYNTEYMQNTVQTGGNNDQDVMDMSGSPTVNNYARDVASGEQHREAINPYTATNSAAAVVFNDIFRAKELLESCEIRYTLERIVPTPLHRRLSIPNRHPLVAARNILPSGVEFMIAEVTYTWDNGKVSTEVVGKPVYV